MPRERIQHGRLYVDMPTEGPEGTGITRLFEPGEDLPKGATVREDQSLEVSWSREGSHVQLSIVMPRDWFDRWVASHRAGGIVDVHAGSPEPVSLYTEVLTRTEINDLIRTLRRARDSAYGADA